MAVSCILWNTIFLTVQYHDKTKSRAALVRSRPFNLKCLCKRTLDPAIAHPRVPAGSYVRHNYRIMKR